MSCRASASSFADEDGRNFVYYEAESVTLLDFEIALVGDRDLVIYPAPTAPPDAVPVEKFAALRLPSDAVRVVCFLKKDKRFILVFLHDSSSLVIPSSKIMSMRGDYNIPRAAYPVAGGRVGINVWIRTNPANRKVYAPVIRDLWTAREDVLQRWLFFDGSGKIERGYSRKRDQPAE